MENLGVSLQDYQSFGQGAGNASQAELDELVKAMSAGSITGRETTGSTTASGAPLKTESLETTLKVLTNTERDIVLWKMIPKLAAYNTVEEYNQLVSYGTDGGSFTNEGELPESSDTIYRRQAQLVKFMGTTGEVTHPMQLVSTMVGNMIQREVQNRTQKLLRDVDTALFNANSDIVPQEFNGLHKQHFDGYAGTLDTYQDSEVVVDLRGKVLRENNVEDAANGVNLNFGYPDKIIAAPGVFNNYVKNYSSQKLIQPNTQQVTAGVMGQKVVKIVTQFGEMDIVDDKFARKGTISVLIGAAATNVKVPTTPVADGVAPTAVATDTLNRFQTAFASDYFYAVAAKNRYGVSSPIALGASAQTVGATQSVDLKFTDGGGAYPATGYVIYRSEKGAAAKYTQATCPLFPILEVSKAQFTAGYDGAAAGLVRDRNRTIPNCETALVIEHSEQIYSFKQLAPLMKMDLATLSPSTRFMILLYGTPILYAPKKFVRIINIGNDTTV